MPVAAGSDGVTSTVMVGVALLPELADEQVSVPGAAELELDPPDPELDGQVATVPTEETTPGVVWLLGRVMRHLVPDRHVGLLRGVQRHLHLPGGRGGLQHRLAGLGAAPELGRQGRHPQGGGLEYRLAEGQRAVLGHPQGGLELLHGRGGGRPEGGGSRAELSRGGVAERDQIRVELGHVGAGRPGRQGPIGGCRAVQQHHRAVVHPVEHLTLRDDLAEGGQLGVCPAGLVDHRVRRAV